MFLTNQLSNKVGSCQKAPRKRPCGDILSVNPPRLVSGKEAMGKKAGRLVTSGVGVVSVMEDDTKF